MTRDLLIVSTRALTATDLGASVAAVRQGQPWTVTDDGDHLTLTYRGRPLLRLAASTRLSDETLPRWQTRLTLIGDEPELGLEVGRAVAWEADGDLTEMPDGTR